MLQLQQRRGSPHTHGRPCLSETALVLARAGPHGTQTNGCSATNAPGCFDFGGRYVLGEGLVNDSFNDSFMSPSSEDGDIFRSLNEFIQTKDFPKFFQILSLAASRVATRPACHVAHRLQGQNASSDASPPHSTLQAPHPCRIRRSRAISGDWRPRMRACTS